MDDREFETLVAPHRRELQVHCYRMLGSIDDAEDALQETLVAAWKAIDGFEGRSSVRAWLYRIATNVCLRAAERRPRRIVSWDHAPARDPHGDLGAPTDQPWLEPFLTDGPDAPVDPAAAATDREGIGLAFLAALQHLPPNQRAVLILRDVLAFTAAETAELLDTSPASVNSALQRAKATLDAQTPVRGPIADDADTRRVVEAFVAAFEAADIDALVGLLAAEVRFTMPPLPAWFDGRADVAAFIRDRAFATPWRVRLTRCNDQPAMLCYQDTGDGVLRLNAINVLDVRGTGHGARIAWIASFLEPGMLAGFGFPMTFAE